MAQQLLCACCRLLNGTPPLPATETTATMKPRLQLTLTAQLARAQASPPPPSPSPVIHHASHPRMQPVCSVRRWWASSSAAGTPWLRRCSQTLYRPFDFLHSAAFIRRLPCPCALVASRMPTLPQRPQYACCRCIGGHFRRGQPCQSGQAPSKTTSSSVKGAYGKAYAAARCSVVECTARSMRFFTSSSLQNRLAEPCS